MLSGDSVSSQQSSAENSLSAPSTQPSELSAAPPDRKGPTPPPQIFTDIDFEREMKVKYRRSSNVPDYRQTMFGGEPVTNGKVPVFAPTYTNGNGTSSPRRNSVQNGNGASTNGRYSPAVNCTTNGSSNGNTASPRVSDVSTRSRRSVSLESNRRQAVMSYPAARTNGAVSPLTVRSISPVGWRSGAVSPIGGTRSSSPSAAQRYRNSPLSTTMNGQKAAARRTIALPTLDTQMNGPGPGKKAPDAPTSEEDEEAMDEVISLSPAVRAPVMKFKRQSSGLSLHALASASAPHLFDPTGSSMMLDTVLEDASGDGKKYFGQDVNAEDLVAVNLENAFDRL